MECTHTLKNKTDIVLLRSSDKGSEISLYMSLAIKKKSTYFTHQETPDSPFSFLFVRKINFSEAVSDAYLFLQVIKARVGISGNSI